MVRQQSADQQQPAAAPPPPPATGGVATGGVATASGGQLGTMPPAGAIPPSSGPPTQLHPHELYCAPYGEYYPPDYFMPAPDMCPPQLCALHGDYSGVGSLGGLGVPGVLQQMVDENGAVRHVIVAHHHHHMGPPHAPPPPHPQHPQHPQHHHQQHYGPANGGTGPTYYGPPGGFGPPHYHVGHPPPPPHHVTHSPPPPLPSGTPYHKDERTHRQYVKLKKKLEQKHTTRNNGLDVNSGSSTPSPRKELLNGTGSTSVGGGDGVGSRGGAASTSSEGEGSSTSTASVQGDDDDATTALIDMLSSARPPQVSEVTSYSALVQWTAPIPPGVSLPAGELIYELLLGDKGRYKAIYSGPSLSCRVRDLRPGTEYSVCLQVRAGELTGDASSAASFRAPPAIPGAPSPPRAHQRSRSSLQLRWQPATDNGSRILHYILECDSGDGSFTEVAKPRSRQHAANGLKAGARYRFRLAAVNECGRGPWSEEVSLWTNGIPPPPPSPPRLTEAGPHSLHLNWTIENSSPDQILLHELQIEDERNKYGFRPVYKGPGYDHLCDGLDRRTSYKFRLRASNDDEVQSRWSTEVSFATSGESPGPPGKPTVKGKIHSRSFRIRWDSPSDDGGAEALSYAVEIDSGEGFKCIYEGIENEALCDKLQPGTAYRIRVRSVSEGGFSDWSDIQMVTTEPTCPDACDIPWLTSKAKSNSASIAWRKPDYDGGALVHEYQVDLTDSKGERSTIYIGSEMQCEITDLLPGMDYEVQVKATNRAGVGPFSQVFVFKSDAASPDAPAIPEASVKSPYHVRVDWNEPSNNGSSIIDYHLEMSTTNVDNLYIPIFHGLQTGYDVKSLTPFKTYYFRVSASNSAGMSAWSPVCSCETPRSTPAAPSLPRADCTATTIDLFWQAPANHGSPIMQYLIDIGDEIITTGPVEEYTLEGLMPDTVYRIKLIAVNEIGASSPSSTLRVSTRPPPPPPPRLECVQRGHNYLKLKWGDGKNADFTQFSIEMESLRVPDDFQCVYSGTAYTCKVKKLLENTTYRFRTCATNDHGGEGDYSVIYAISTSFAPPPAMAAPQVTSVDTNSIQVEWSPPDNLNDIAGEPLLYTMQCCKTKDQIYKQVYHGVECHTQLDGLESGCEYCLRISAVRGALQGAWSSVVKVSTPVIAAVPASTPSTPSPRPRKPRPHGPLSDRHWAMLLLAGFMLVAVLAAAAVERFINWRRASDA